MGRPELDALPRALTIKTVAALTDTSPDVWYEAIAAGTCPLPVLRIGRCIRIPRSAVFASLGIAEPAEAAEHECCGQCGTG